MKKIKNLTKRIFNAKRVGTLAMLLFCGVAATYAQNAAGDYTAGTNALTTVTEEIAKYVPYVVKLCYAIAGVVAVVGAISVYIAMNNEENHDGRWSMYLPCSRCTGSAFVLRCLTINQAVWIRHDKGIDQSSIRQLSHVQGASETP